MFSSNAPIVKIIISEIIWDLLGAEGKNNENKMERFQEVADESEVLHGKKAFVSF